MDIFKDYEKLKTNTEYKKFQRDEPDYYLVHILIPDDNSSLEFGFFSPKKNKIIVFKTNPYQKMPEDDAFKEGKTITELDINNIKINFKDAMNKAQEILKKDHSAELVKKKIILLQHIQEDVWNLTFICTSLNIINIRINAKTGTVIRNHKDSLLNMAGMAK
ncbi:MAG: hypothetical protein ACLFN8_00645 [Candidatus Woesearchaeota archaeon]